MTDANRDVGEGAHILLLGLEIAVLTMEKSLWKVIEMLNIDLLDDLNVPVLGMYSKDTIYYSRDPC